MSAAKPTLYDVLGLSPTATPAEIKKRYRELARRYHPDVASSPDAAGRFKEINEANRVLSDPERRAAYDAELTLARMRQQQAGFPPPHPRGPSASRPHDSRPSRPPPPRPRPTAEPLVTQAQQAFARMRFREAESLCRQALRLDRRCALAYEILGDIHRARGRTDEALAMYSYVVQLDRANRSAREKMDRLLGRPTGPTMAGHAARASRFAPLRRARTTSTGGEMTPARALVNALGLGLLAFLLVSVGVLRDPPAHDPWFVGWDLYAVFSLISTGGACGFLMAVNGLLAPAHEQLALRSSGRPRRFTVPLGAVLVAFALVNFYAALLVYMVIAFVQEAVSRSVLRAFAVSFAVAVVFAVIQPVGAVYLLLSGGNLVFAGLVAGWLLGDVFRP